MLKIRCPECTRSFIWTDDAPLEGKCPNPDCEWLYDVRAELKKNVGRRLRAEERGPSCPRCAKPLSSRWTVCPHCGDVVAGSRSFPRRHILVFALAVLLALSLLYQAWTRF
jgi:ribosomal protein L37AE/L43A